MGHPKDSPRQRGKEAEIRKTERFARAGVLSRFSREACARTAEIKPRTLRVPRMITRDPGMMSTIL